jgi:hypothetical protein
VHTETLLIFYFNKFCLAEFHYIFMVLSTSLTKKNLLIVVNRLEYSRLSIGSSGSRMCLPLQRNNDREGERVRKKSLGPQGDSRYTFLD